MNKLSLIALALILLLCAPLALADAAPAETAAPAEAMQAAEPAAEPAEAAAPAESTQAAEPAAEPAAPALTMQTVLATVNGVDVTYADVVKYYNSITAQFGQMYDITDPSIAGPLKEMSINYAVTEQVVKQKAKELGLDTFTDEEMQAMQLKVDDNYKKALDQISALFVNQGLAEDQVESTAVAYLESNNYTPETVLAQTKDSELFARVFATVTGDLDMEEEALKALFDQKVAAAKEAYAKSLAQYDADVKSNAIIYYVPQGVRAVKHILINMDRTEAAELKNTIAKLDALPQDDPGRAELEKKIADLKAPVQAKLDEIMAKVAAGEDFEALIDAYGEDPGMKQGAASRETGYEMNKDTTQFVPEFQAAGMALEKPGDVSEPILTDFGYHIIRYDHDIESKTAEYEATKIALKEAALAEQRTALQNEAIEAWSAAATIETFPDRFTA